MEGSRRTRRLDIIINLAIISIVVASLVPVYRGDGPSGNDTYGHLFRIWCIGKGISEDRNIPIINLYWYAGEELLSYPPLFYLFSTPFILALGDVFLTYEAIVTAIVALIAISAYWTARKLDHSPVASMAMSLLFAYHPFNMRLIFECGGIPQAFSLIFLPITYLIVQRILSSHIDRKTIVLYGGFAALSILSHAMVAYQLAICLGILILVQAGLKREIGPVFSSFFKFGLVLMLGLSLSACWVIPNFLFPGHPTNLSTPDRAIVNSVTPAELFSRVLYSRNVCTTLFIVALLSTLLRRTRRKTALFISGLASMVLALGVNGPLLHFIPLNSMISAPDRFLHYTAFVLAFLVGGLVDEAKGSDKRAKLWKVGLIAMVLVSAVAEMDQSADMIIPRGLRPEFSDVLREVPVDGIGRVAAMDCSDSYMAYAIPVDAGRSTINGWYIEGTALQQHIVLMLVSLSKSDQEVMFRKLDLYAVEYVITDWTSKGRRAKEVFQSSPEQFEAVKENDSYALFKRTGDISLVRPLEEETILIVSREPTVIQYLIPGAYSTSRAVEGLDLDYLSLFDKVILYKFECGDAGRAERLLSDYLGTGGEVFVDLFGSDVGPFGFFGVQPVRANLFGHVEFLMVDQNSSYATDLDSVPFSYDGGGWIAPSYSGLDEVFIWGRMDGEKCPLIGVEATENGSVTFIGGNLFYHAYYTDSSSEKELLWSVLNCTRSDSRTREDLQLWNLSLDYKGLNFQYSSFNGTKTLISIAYSPHWRATVDGQSVEVQELENLILVDLPDGSHHFELSQAYDTTSVLSGLLSLLTFVFALQIRKRAGGGDHP